MKLIKEALDKKKKSINEAYRGGVKSGKEFDLLELLKKEIGAENVLDSLADGLGTDKLSYYLAEICRDFEFDNKYLVNYEEEEELDEAFPKGMRTVEVKNIDEYLYFIDTWDGKPTKVDVLKKYSSGYSPYFSLGFTSSNNKNGYTIPTGITGVVTYPDIEGAKRVAKANAKGIFSYVEESLTEDYETDIDWEGGVQEITRGDYYNFLDSVQPIYWTRINNTVEPGTATPEYSEVFLAGGAFDYDEEKKKNLYAKFGKKDGKYYYLGLDYVDKVK